MAGEVHKQVSKVRALGEHPRKGVAPAFVWMKQTMNFAQGRALLCNAFDFTMTVTSCNVKRMGSMRPAKG